MLKKNSYLLFMLIGLGLLAQGVWIPVKAEIAQWLLEDAWQQTKLAGGQYKPWTWADHWPVARLTIPSLSVEQIVLAGDSGHVLAFAPGMNLQAAKPGEGGTSIISGHRDTHFRFMQHLNPGQLITVETAAGKLTYSVLDSQVVNAQTTGIAIDDGLDQLLLVTCYPFDTPIAGGPLRYVITAEPVPI